MGDIGGTPNSVLGELRKAFPEVGFSSCDLKDKQELVQEGGRRSGGGEGVAGRAVSCAAFQGRACSWECELSYQLTVESKPESRQVGLLHKAVFLVYEIVLSGYNLIAGISS